MENRLAQVVCKIDAAHGCVLSRWPLCAFFIYISLLLTIVFLLVSIGMWAYGLPLSLLNLSIELPSKFWVIILIPSLFSDVGLLNVVRQTSYRRLLRKRGWPPVYVFGFQMDIPHCVWNLLPPYEEWVLTPMAQAYCRSQTLYIALAMLNEIVSLGGSSHGFNGSMPEERRRWK